MPDFDVVLADMSFTECPRWHGGRLVLADFYTRRVLALDPNGGVEELAQVPAQPSGLGWTPDGDLLVVSMRDRRILRRAADGTLAEHADLSGIPEVTGHLNDMVVDGEGRAYVGNFGFDLMGGGSIASTVLVRVDPDGSTHVVADGLLFPNGMVITPDGATLVVAETVGQRLTAFSIAEDGSLHDKRTWAEFAPAPTSEDLGEVLAAPTLTPDGICLDAEGAIWVADATGGRLVRVREGGELSEERSPGTGVFACMLGGDDGRTLFACAAPSFLEHEREGTREAQVLSTRVDVAHAGRP